MSLNDELIPKRINEHPTIADRVIIDLLCPDADGCFLNDPYKVNNVTIYYVSRDYSGQNFSSYDKQTFNTDLKAQLDTAIQTACQSPTADNLAIVDNLTTQFNASINTNTFYFNESTPVAIFGTDENPAWIYSDESNSFLIHVTSDDVGNTIYGHFELDWTPLGMREGDYFVCWTWTPNPSGQTLSSSIHFNLDGSTLLTTSIPTHFTDPEKYPTLLERYLPEMFKLKIAPSDLTPEVFNNLNLAIGDGYTFLENLANQTVDLIDANSTNEAFLPLLGDLFKLKLRTNDPTLWRRQIKRAVPLAKKKGTYSGLSEALDETGITLTRLSRLWQVISKYTYQELFDYSGSNVFALSKVALPIDSDNCEVYRRNSDDSNWNTLDYNSIQITADSNGYLTVLTWIGLPLNVGDSIRVVYKIAEVLTSEEQSIENYVRLLPLADQRDERDQDYPLKNWNVRVIEEDDPLVDQVLTERHPYNDPIIFGQVRTEFPYSENIYNMEEYNGSRRDSTDPCDIDKNFIDPCSMCLGSKYVVDLEIEDLSTDRIIEAQEIINDYSPFHSVIHSINLTGSVIELIQSPVEELEALIRAQGQEFTLSGNGETIFNRTMEPSDLLKRDELASFSTVVSNDTGTAKNGGIYLYSPSVSFEYSPLNKDYNYTYLEILSPSANAGTYGVGNAYRNTVEILSGSVTEPVDESSFTFNLSNLRAVKNLVTIYKDNYITFIDSNKSLNTISTVWDTLNDPAYYPYNWTIYFPLYGTFNIQNILPDGSLVLEDDPSLPTSTVIDVTYTIYDETSNVVVSNNTGKITISLRGRVDFSGNVVVNGDTVTLDSIQNLMGSYYENGRNHYLLYSGTQYAFNGFVKDSTTQFYISNWSGGTVSGIANASLYQRLANNKIGYLSYKGLTLTTTTNYETTLSIQNGANADSLYSATDASGNPYTLQLDNNSFMENYLILINSDYYAITNINGTLITLAGPDQVWKTSGTSVNFDIIKYDKEAVSIPERVSPPMDGHDFEYLDRQGNDVIEASVPVQALATIFNTPDDQKVELTNQQEGISFSIKTKDGNTFEGEL